MGVLTTAPGPLPPGLVSGEDTIGSNLKPSVIPIRRCQPLYSRVPSRDSDGNRLSDFMVLISGLRSQPSHLQLEKIAALHGVLSGFSEVVFAELNVRLNLLWVSVRPRYGVITGICGELQRCIPEAKLVGPYGGMAR